MLNGIFLGLIIKPNGFYDDDFRLGYSNH